MLCIYIQVNNLRLLLNDVQFVHLFKGRLPNEGM